MRINLDKLLYILALLLGLSSQGYAMESFVVKDIRAEGIEHVSAGTIFNYLPVKAGDTFDESRSGEAIRALFKTGFFKDVKLRRDGDVLVVVVKERPVVSDITITGNSDISTDNLMEGLGKTGLAKGQVYKQALLDKVGQELRRQYYSDGKYGVKIKTDAKELDNNRVDINIDINEGKAAKIKQINIVGNKAFSDKELLKKFKLNTPTMFSFITKSDQYSKQKLGADLETLRSWYLDHGYINFNIDSTQVSVSPDKSDVYITINVTEGDQYRIAEVKLAGDLRVSPQELFKLVTIKKGMIFSRKAVTKGSKNITERLGEDGYAFANVNSIPKIDKQNKTVALTYFVDPGKRVYVRRINFDGNTKTRDEVLRREMRQLEGAWIDTKKIERSKVRLQRLGYFKDVNVETPAVPGSTDQVDVNFAVEENPSGNLSLGLGFSQSSGIIFNSSVTQDNFLGSGKSVSFAFNNSDINRRFVFGYTNPYWTIDGVSRGFRVSYEETNANSANITRFNTKVISGGMNFGIPVSEFNFLRLSFNYEHTKLDTGNIVASEVQQFVDENGKSFNALRLGSSFTYDTRNKAVLPTSGTLHRIAAQITTPGGDLRYYKLDYKAQWFYPMTDQFTLLLKGNVGYGDSYGATTRLPFFENFFAGGPRSVRGYQENTLGPLDSTGRAIGGDLKVVGNAEVILPVPFVTELKSVRLTGFVDMGNVYGRNDSFDASTLRMSTGISGLWLSPFGVLTASVALPFNDQSQDKTQSFQFTFGTSF